MGRELNATLQLKNMSCESPLLALFSRSQKGDNGTHCSQPSFRLFQCPSYFDPIQHPPRFRRRLFLIFSCGCFTRLLFLPQSQHCDFALSWGQVMRLSRSIRNILPHERSNDNARKPFYQKQRSPWRERALCFCSYRCNQPCQTPREGSCQRCS